VTRSSSALGESLEVAWAILQFGHAAAHPPSFFASARRAEPRSGERDKL